MNRPQGVVEIFGMPGVGKTTTALLIERALKDTCKNVISGHDYFDPSLSRFQRNFRRVALIIRELPHTFLAVWGLKFILVTSQRSVHDKLKSVFNFLTLQSLLSLRARRRTLLILDQGIFQAVWSLALFSGEEPNLLAWIDKLRPGLDCNWHVIILEAEHKILMDRIEMRESKHSRLQMPEAIKDSETWAQGNFLSVQLQSIILKLENDSVLSVERHSTSSFKPQELADRVIAGDLLLRLGRNPTSSVQPEETFEQVVEGD